MTFRTGGVVGVPKTETRRLCCSVSDPSRT